MTAVAGAAGLFLLFAVALNVFIRTRLLRSVISYEPKSLLIDYERAYSLWPGHIHVEGLVIRSSDWNVEWALELDRCDFDAHFLALFHREFHAGPVVCDGLDLRLRQRKDHWTAADLAANPPVPGFSDPALHPPGPEPPPLTDAKYNLWTIHLDDVVARHVREVWVDGVRVDGDAEVRGRWIFRPIRWLDVGPATVAMHALRVAQGMGEPLADDVAGDVRVTVHPFDLRTVDQTGMLSHVSVDGDAEAKAHVAEILRLLAPKLRAEGQDAILSTHLALDHGAVLGGSRVGTSAFHVKAAGDGLSVAGTLRLSAQVDAPDRAHARVSARELVATLGDRALRGNVNVALYGRREGDWVDLARSGISFVGTVSAHPDGQNDDTPPDWWLKAELRRGVVSTTGRRARVDVAVQAKDASPLAAAVVASTPLPSWLVNAVSTKGFSVDGEILVSPAAIEARHVDARAQGIAAQFAFLRQPAATDWALYVDVDALSAAIDSHDGKAEVVLLGARSRFDERAAAIRASGVRE